MPIRSVIDKERRLVLTTAEGIVRFAEAKLHQDQLVTNPNLDRTFNQLIDATTASDIAISIEEAGTLARRTVLSPESRRAIVATEKSVYGMFRLMQAYHELTEGHSHVGVFYDFDEALRWLGDDERS